MKQTRNLSMAVVPPLGLIFALVASVLVLAGSTAILPARAAAQSSECVATGPTLGEAKDAYAATCAAPRVDCDKLDGLWHCSSQVIGNAAPGGVTAPDPTPATPTPATPETVDPDPEVSEPADPVAEAPEPADPVAVAPEPDPATAANGTACAASGATLNEARNNYDAQCAEPRLDCDPAGENWTCSSAILGSAAPDGATTADPADPTDPDPTAPDPTDPEPAEPEPTPTEPDPTPTPQPTPVDPEPTDAVIEQTYGTTAGPDTNPMKGWNSGWWNDNPESSVGFQYIKWSDFEPTNGEFDFGAVEDIISRPGSQNRHLVLRLYCDWHGDEETSQGCPDWIYSQVGVDRIEGDNGRYITDYNDSRYIDEAVQAIQALGDRYDDDPRIYTFQLGLIGYWGEWHTYGSQIDGSPYDIAPLTEQRILGAYLDAFDRVHVMGRYPYGSTLSDTTQIGFHNDYFRPNNGHSADFDESIAAGSRWLQGPIGGEIPPGLSNDDFYELYATPQGAQMIDTAHYSTMQSSTVAPEYRDEYMALHRRFGYTYQIDNAVFSATQPTNGQTNVVLSVSNTGVAPFYYDWDVQFGLIAADGSAVAVADSTSYDLRDANPGDAFNLAGAIELDDVATGEYRLAVRILQPGADDPKSGPWGLDARNTYVLFANDMPVIDGQWNSANALEGGWSILGTTSVG